MKKLACFSLFIIILSLYMPDIHVSANSPPPSSSYLNKYKELFTGVSSNEFNGDFNIIVHGNTSFLYLGRGVLYPTNLLPISTYKTSSSNNLIRRLKGDWRKIPLRLILEYKNLEDKKKVISIIPKLGGDILYVYHAFPFVAVEIPLENFSKISSYEASFKIMVDYKVSINLNESVPIIKPPDKWSQLESSIGKEINGSGIIIGILDTGIYGRHPDFYFPNGTCKIIYNVSFVPSEDALDRFGHGTHVAGIAAGTGLASHGVFKGVAPGSLLANIKVLADNGTGYVSWILEGIEYAINKSIDIINLSLGGGGNGVGDDPLSIALDVAARNGIVSVVAAGNGGPYYYSLGTPAVSRGAITVGAVEKNLSIAVFSSRGPTGDLRIKPDVVAPGADIFAPLAEDSYLEKVFSSRYPKDIIHGVNGSYIKLSGTSMATPHVAGVAALILQIHKNYTPEMIKSAIMSTAIDIGLDSFTEGNGLVNAYYAVKTHVLIINSSNSFGDEPKPMDSILYTLLNEDNISHSVKIVSIMLNKLYCGELSNSSSFLKINGLPQEVSSNSSINFTVSLLSLPPPGVYSSSVKLQVDNIYNLTFTFSLAVMIKIVTNITYFDRYIDGYFIMYDKGHPSDFILPAGYKYSEGNKFKYSVWFYVKPGNYSLFVASSNSPDESSHLINGPMYLATRSLSLSSDMQEIHLYFKVEEATHYKIPFHDMMDNLIIPYFRILSFKSSVNNTLGIFTGGLWNITTQDIYFSLYSGDTIYLNFQFIKIPKLFEDNITKGIRYSTDLYTASWEFNLNPVSFELPILYRYNILSNSIVDNDLGKVGLVVFPPRFNLTYVGIMDFFQGGKYFVHTNIPHIKEHIGILVLGVKGFKYRSLAYLDPTTSQSTDIRVTSPPYTPFTYVERGVKNGDYYLNISSALITTFSPLNILGEGNSSMKIFVNGTLMHQDTESGDLDYHEKDYIKWAKGIFSVYSSYNLSYPLYQSVYSYVYFNTDKADYIPPIPYQFKIPVILKENSSIQFIFLENLWLDNISLYYSWDNGKSWEKNNYTISSQRRGVYNEYLINTSILDYGRLLSIKIGVWDESGNHVSITMYNVSSSMMRSYPTIPDLYFYPRYASPNENISLYMKDTGESNVYGLPVYVDGYLYFNLPINASEHIMLRNFIHYDLVGEHQLESLLNYNVLRKPVKLVSKLAVTYLYIPYVFVKGERINVSKEDTITYRADVDRLLHIKIPIEWIHNNSPAANVYVVINGSTYITDRYGFINLNISSNRVGLTSYRIEKVYYRDTLTNITFDEAVLKIKCLKIIWDYVKLSLVSNIENRYPINNSIHIIVKAVYAYDNQPLNGELILNKIKIIGGENGIYNISLTQAFPGRYNYTITSIVDTEYNLTSFTPLSFNILFDELSAEYKYFINPKSIDVVIKVYFSTDSSPVKNAVVDVNNMKAEEISPGIYKASVNMVSWFQTININIKYNNYKTLNMRFKVEDIFFIIYISILIISLVIIIVYLKLRRR